MNHRRIFSVQLCGMPSFSSPFTSFLLLLLTLCLSFRETSLQRCHLLPFMDILGSKSGLVSFRGELRMTNIIHLLYAISHSMTFVKRPICSKGSSRMVCLKLLVQRIPCDASYLSRSPTDDRNNSMEIRSRRARRVWPFDGASTPLARHRSSSVRADGLDQAAESL